MTHSHKFTLNIWTGPCSVNDHVSLVNTSSWPSNVQCAAACCDAQMVTRLELVPQQMQEEQDVLRMELKAKDSVIEMAKLEKERLVNKFHVEAGNYITLSICSSKSISSKDTIVLLTEQTHPVRMDLVWNHFLTD